MHKSTKKKFQQHENHLQRSTTFHTLKTKLLKCFMWPVLMYSCKTWTVTTKTMKNLESAEMWFYCRILHITWTAHQTNVSVLQTIGQEHKLLCCIEQRQLKFLGHVICKDELEILLRVLCFLLPFHYSPSFNFQALFLLFFVNTASSSLSFSDLFLLFCYF